MPVCTAGCTLHGSPSFCLFSFTGCPTPTDIGMLKTLEHKTPATSLPLPGPWRSLAAHALEAADHAVWNLYTSLPILESAFPARQPPPPGVRRRPPLRLSDPPHPAAPCLRVRALPADTGPFPSDPPAPSAHCLGNPFRSTDAAADTAGPVPWFPLPGSVCTGL